MTVFLDDDTRELLRSFSPARSRSNALPPLVLTSDGDALMTLEHLEAKFQDQILNGTERLSISNLAKQFDVDQDIVNQLVEIHPTSPWRSIDKDHIVTQNERDEITKKVTGKLQGSLLIKPKISTFYDIDTKSVDDLLESLGLSLLSFGNYVCSETYRNLVSAQISNSLLQPLAFFPTPVSMTRDNLPGHPPLWFASQILEELLQTNAFSGKFCIKTEAESIECIPTVVIEQERDHLFALLRSGSRPHIELGDLLENFPELYTSIEDVKQHAQTVSGVEVIDPELVSSMWILKTVNECTEGLRKNGITELKHWRLVEDGRPELKGRILDEIALLLSKTLDQVPVSIGNFLLTESRVNTEHDALRTYTGTDATTQWQQLKQNPNFDIKFQFHNIVSMIQSSESILEVMIETKSVQKLMDEQFWATITEKEDENEVEFASFWTERVISRCHLYNESLEAVTDLKLREQLTELSVTFVQKELVPDAITKARSLGLVLSRKTRKNLEKLESKLRSPASMDMRTLITIDAPALTVVLNRFSTKQGIELPSTSTLEEAKATMLQDMKRRMQKQRKSDGPVLFLALVIMLFANQYPGVIYATGKFAPKLLKQLKADLHEDLYQKLERWKEAAKTDTLSTEDREEMKKVVEA